MKRIFFLFTFLFSLAVGAQNLVPNPSFEDTVACPNFISQINRASFWTSFRNTPDYFNSCAPNTLNGVSTPSNLAGYQYARTGVAYAGIHIYDKGGSNYREWLADSLTQPLAVGVSYLISFFVNMAYKPNGFGIAANKIGARFSTLPYPSNNQLTLNGYSHIHIDSVITDTLNWIEVSGSFIADSSYKYIVIGNFFSDSLTSISTPDTNILYSYYFIDDVSVIQEEEGIDDLHNLHQLKVFPNPANGWFEIQGNEIQSLTVYDIAGRIVHEDSKFISPARINISSWSKGMYFIKAFSKNKMLLQKLIVH